MDSLRVGDKVSVKQTCGRHDIQGTCIEHHFGSALQVLVSGLNARARYESIFMFSHRSATQLSDFLVLQTANNISLTVSPGHYLLISEGKALIRAADAKLGDYVWTMPESQPGADLKLMPSRLVSIMPSAQEGLYNPHTFSGTIIVNQVAAATFTDTIPPSLSAHLVLTIPALLLYMVVPSFVADLLNNAILALHFGPKPTVLATLAAAAKHCSSMMV